MWHREHDHSSDFRWSDTDIKKKNFAYAKSENGDQLDHSIQSRVSFDRAASCIGGPYKVELSQLSEQKLRKAVNEYLQSSVEMNESYTFPVQNKVIGNLMESVLACQNCNQVLTKIKQLNCFHLICQNCLGFLKTKHLQSGQWMINCTICHIVTSWYGNAPSELQDIDTVNKIISQTKCKKNSKFGNEKTDYITMYGEQDLTINIVSFNKEKLEIKKVLETAQEKMNKCKLQCNKVQEYEKHVMDSKTLLEKQIKHASDLYVSFVRCQQTQLLKELTKLFEKEFEPVKKAKAAIEMQSQSLELVQQCCAVASRILENGGAPLDLNNFKKMVWNTMKKSETEKLPKEIQTQYKCRTYFKGNDFKYELLAEDLGSLVSKSTILKEKTNKKVCQSTENLTAIELNDEEPIYDIPPDAANKYASLNKLKKNDESIYDEIPFNENVCLLNLEPEEVNTNPQDPVTSFPHSTSNIATINNETVSKAMEIMMNRRRAINGDISDAEESDDSFSSDSFSSASIVHASLPKAPHSEAQTSQTHTCTSDINQHTLPNSGQHKADSIKANFDPSRDTEVSIDSSVHLIPDVKSQLIQSIGRVKKGRFATDEVYHFPQLPEFTVGCDGTLWVCDAQNHEIKKYDTNTFKLSGIFKTTVQGVNLKPKSIAVNSLENQVAVTCGKYATVWTFEGKLIRQIGPHPDFGNLGGVAFDSKANIILADVDNASVVFVNQRTKIHNVSEGGNVLGKSPWQGRIAVNQYDEVIVPDYGGHCIKIFDKSGILRKKFGSFGVGKGQFRYPSCVAVDFKNRIYVADECNNRISMFSPNGDFLHQIVTKDDGLSFPHAVGLLSNGVIAIADDSKTIKIYKTYKHLN